MADEKVKVLVVDGQAFARRFFTMNIDMSPRYELLASLSDADDAVRYCDEHQVDLILMGVMMRSGIDGITAAGLIKEKQPQIRIIIISSTAEITWENRARETGAESFWYKEYSEMPILEVMDRTMTGEKVYPELPPQVDFGAVMRDDLSERELAVLRELTAGASNRVVAEKLGISVNTVRTYIQRMLNKTGYHDRLALVLHARERGLVISETERLAGVREKKEDNAG